MFYLRVQPTKKPADRANGPSAMRHAAAANPVGVFSRLEV